MFNRVVLGLLVVCVSACAPNVIAPVEERLVITERQEIQQYGGHIIRIVKPGDTLYSIAFESSLSIKDLAAWNGISHYKHLNVGRRLRLTRPFDFDESQVKPLTHKSTNVPPILKLKAKAPAALVDKRTTKTVKKQAVKNKALNSPKVSRRAEKVSTTIRQPNVTPPTERAMNKSASVAQWVWPVAGRVLRTFSPANGRQGIDISVPKGQPIVASRQGEVVYVGSGLKGYGKLIIVKHDADYLSAYAHNAKILVSEGQAVKANQTIGVSGLNGRGEPALQFQIRLDGNSVNPLPFLRGQ